MFIYINHNINLETDMLLGHWEILAIALLVLLLFGGKKLPELARGLGKSITNFKSGLHEGQEEDAETPVNQEKEAPQKEEVSKILN